MKIINEKRIINSSIEKHDFEYYCSEAKKIMIDRFKEECRPYISDNN